MATYFEWSESNGAGEVVTDDVANLNFGSIDAAELVPLSYPILAGNNSFAKYIRGKFFADTGETPTISNIKFWKSSGAYKTGEEIVAAANVAYATPSASDTGDSAIPTVEGSALSINSYEGQSTIEIGESDVSGYTGYIRLQLQTSGSTPAGAANQKEFTIQYDSI